MAFAATQVRDLGIGGGLRVIRFQWTGSEGDAPGTIVVRGGKVWGGEIWKNSSGGYVKAPFSFAAGSTSGTQTVTVENIAGCSDGYGILFVS